VVDLNNMNLVIFFIILQWCGWGLCPGLWYCVLCHMQSSVWAFINA